MEPRIEELIEGLKSRNIEAKYCATATEAIDMILNHIPKDSTICWGGSMTIRDMGLTKALHSSGKYHIIDRDSLTTPEEKRKAYLSAFNADYYLTSANAISQNGVIVNIDGNGNRVAAITYGPKHVIFVISIKKIAPTPQDALRRIRQNAAPTNAQRFDIQTPCKADGLCHNCNSPQCICNHIHFLRNAPVGRIEVILLGEDYGY